MRLHLAVAAFALAACADSTSERVPPAIQDPSSSNAVAIGASARADVVTVMPRELDTAFRNPGKGWLMYDHAPMIAPGGAEATPLASTVYTNQISWGDVEPYEGVYRWFLIDRLLNAYPGRKIRIAITLLDPTSRPWFGATGEGQFPKWLWPQLCPTGNECRGRWASSFYGRALTDPALVEHTRADEKSLLFEPHYWDPVFLAKHESFIRALAKRYFYNDEATALYAGAPDWSDRIEAVDMGTYGTWGEWHSELTWPSPEVQRTTLRTMARHYHDAFQTFAKETGKPMPELEQSVVASSASWHNDIYREDDPTAVRYSVETLGSSMVRKFLGADAKEFFKDDEARLVRENVERSPFRLEWGSCTGGLGKEAFCLGKEPDTLDRAIDRAIELKASFIGWYTDPRSLAAKKDGSTDTLEQFFQKKAGYRFHVERVIYPRAVERERAFAVESIWHNRGSGKLYRHYGLRAYLAADGVAPIPLDVSDALDAETWPTGPSGPHTVTPRFTVPRTVQPGTYRLQVAVVDAKGNPAMNLATEGKVGSGDDYAAYELGSIDVR